MEWCVSKTIQAMDAPTLRVLLVDDDEDDRQLIRMALTDAIESVVIEEMSSGQELVVWLDNQRKLKESGSDEDSTCQTIILLDMHMPDLTGLETLQALGDIRDLAYMPVVMLTATVNETLKQQAYQQGIHLYMVKPSQYRGFYRVVEAVKLCYRDAQRMCDQIGMQ